MLPAVVRRVDSSVLVELAQHPSCIAENLVKTVDYYIVMVVAEN